MRLKQPELKRARIEIIPMIDTIFFLLVFFMITWLSMVKMNGLTLSVPRINHSNAAPPASVVLSVSPSGGYFVGSDKSTVTDWETRLRAKLIAQPQSIVVLNVAPNQRTQTLIGMMDRVNRVIQGAHSTAQVLVVTPRVAAPAHGSQEAPHVSR
jgi:biopolymer transport protein ExbD